VITNLLSNAANSLRRVRQVTIAWPTQGRPPPITVADRGPGIPDEIQEPASSRNSRRPTRRHRAQGGTGLGPQHRREIVTRLGGSVGYEAREGGGTVFHVDLPVHVPQPEAQAPAPGRPESRSCFTSTMTRTCSGWWPAPSRAAQESPRPRRWTTRVSCWPACGFDLIILDVALRQGSGLELLPQIEALPCRVPVVLFTAQDTDPELASHADAVLTKSRASLQLLVETVERLLARGKRRSDGQDSLCR
jgi:CheY-like chemotaxis protein